MTAKATLLINLGSPNTCEVADVKSYLNEFLMDEKVIDIPYLWRSLLVKGIIVPFRAPKSAAKYKSVWTDNGSPLVHLTKELRRLTEENMHMPVYYCMRYAEPTPTAILNRIAQEHAGLQELVVLPLYP